MYSVFSLYMGGDSLICYSLGLPGEEQMIKLQPMGDEYFKEFKSISIISHAQRTNEAKGLPISIGKVNTEKKFNEMLSEGLKTDAMFFFEIKLEKTIGYLWLGVRESGEKSELFINDIYIDEEYRGNGLGRELMALIENQARKLKISKIGLHVFASNKSAFSLYSNSGFKTISHTMSKDLIL